jgi:FKBP-type peptidyl-prolyl cis-trans isomerase (trigger factor)
MGMTDTQRTRTALGTLLAAALLTLGACGGGGAGGGEDDAAGASDAPTADESSAAAAAPGLDDVPDVVAEVNGEEVTKEEFAPFYEARLQQATAAAQAGGEPADEAAVRTATVEDLVSTELLTQEAEARGIEVSDDDVETELGNLAEEYQLDSADALLAALEEQGTSADEAREQVRTQVVLEELVADEDGDFQPTEKQLRALYAQGRAAAEAQGQPVPPYAEVRPQLEEQAVADRSGKVAQDLVAQLREDAEIVVNLE